MEDLRGFGEDFMNVFREDREKKSRLSLDLLMEDLTNVFQSPTKELDWSEKETEKEEKGEQEEEVLSLRFKLPQ
ncbi:unnamed protein product [Merluccius merluccius]